MIYLDHNATAPMLPEVRDAMAPWWGRPSNPASTHRAGQRARTAVEQARYEVAALVGGDPRGVVFTSGATEANYAWYAGLARLGVRSVAVSAVEHPSTLAAAQQIARAGGEVHPLGVDADGRIDPAPPPGVQAFSMMAANHETGVIQPLFAALAVARARGLRIHVDAVQAAGRIELSLSAADAVVLSAHKLGGPGGVGALVLQDGEPFPPLLGGGGQERGRRAGTVFTAGVVGFGVACRLARTELASRAEGMADLSHLLRREVTALGGRVVGAELLPNTTCVVFPGIPGESAVQSLDLAGFCVSSGAACASGSLDPSPVLIAMGDPEPAGAVRISLGPSTTRDQIEAFVFALSETLTAIRTAAALEL
ncbi:MAG: cysteine desulfurase [Myxococcota bacterium]|jgi:cysteine desulfurase